MKQIIITPKISEMSKQYAQFLFTDKRRNFVQPLTGLKNLKLDLEEVNDGLLDKENFIKYLDEIIRRYNQLLDLLPSRFTALKTNFDQILSPDRLSTTISVRTKNLPQRLVERKKLLTTKQEFFSAIVDRMQFQSARLYLAEFMKKIGICTCVYCNNSSAIYSDEQKEAYYHFDHWLPKDKYPFLCTCFYNLYPCCPNCNGHKLNGAKGSFQLFVEEPECIDPFVFDINRQKYQYHKADTLEVSLNSRDCYNEEYCKEYNTVYRIRQLYNDHSKLVEFQKLLFDIDKYRNSYSDATNSSINGIVDKESLFLDVLGIDGDESIIYTAVNKKLKIDTAVDAGIL